MTNEIRPGTRVRVVTDALGLLGEEAEVIRVEPWGHVRLRLGKSEDGRDREASLEPENVALLVALCPLPGCRKENDLGIKSCWNCGNSLC